MCAVVLTAIVDKVGVFCLPYRPDHRGHANSLGSDCEIVHNCKCSELAAHGTSDLGATHFGELLSMSLFGKILAVLNVLAAIAFVVLAAMDYQRRQDWSFAVLRHDIALRGLPVNEDEKDREGNLLVRELTPG